jgi:signal transduction histidine kinase
MFIHALSHDLRAPARISLGFATALREDYGEALDERGLHYLSRIETNSDRIRDYLDLLLAYARLGRERVVPQPLPLTPVVNSVVNHARDLIAESNAEVELADSFPTVRADPELMGMVLTNLLTNAIKFVEPGRRPHVRISSRSGEGVVWLEVSDNGIGIHEDDIDRIFQPLIRLHGEEAYAGSGLGLAIVQRVVELMDGEVRVDSALGEGCTFRVRLPAMEGIKH